MLPSECLLCRKILGRTAHTARHPRRSQRSRTFHAVKDSTRSYMVPLRFGPGFRVGTLPITPSNINLEGMLGGFLSHRTGTQSNSGARCDGMISAASIEGDGRTPRGGDAPVLPLRYAAPEIGASAERHILHTLISGKLPKDRTKSVQYRPRQTQKGWNPKVPPPNRPKPACEGEVSLAELVDCITELRSICLPRTQVDKSYSHPRR